MFALIVGLFLLTWAASGVVESTAREWFERDVQSRSQLVLIGARPALADSWNDSANLNKQLVALAQDAHVIGVAACGADLSTRAITPGFPQEFSCHAVGSRIRPAGPSATPSTLGSQQWSTEATLPTGRVMVTAMPIADEGQELGFAILVHDFSYVERREARAQTFLIVLSGILAVMVLGILLLVARRVRADWAVELQGLLRKGGKQSRKFQPLLSDVRELIERMASEREADPGLWTAERLKQTLNRDLQGEKIVILANREPYIHNRMDDGSIEVQHPRAAW